MDLLGIHQKSHPRTKTHEDSVSKTPPTELWRRQDDWEAYSKFQAEVGDSVQPLGETTTKLEWFFCWGRYSGFTRSFWGWDVFFLCLP